jgi:transposase
MDCDVLRDDQWERIRGFVPGGTKGKRGPRTDNRKFLDALLWMARSGGRWRDLPERLGDYKPHFDILPLEDGYKAATQEELRKAPRTRRPVVSKLFNSEGRATSLGWSSALCGSGSSSDLRDCCHAPIPRQGHSGQKGTSVIPAQHCN